MAKRFICVLTLAAALCVAPVGGQVGNKASKSEMPPDRWRAWAVTAGTHTMLTVEGIYQSGGPGVVAVMKPATPQGINPKVLVLDLKVGMLPGMWPAILHANPAHHTQSPYRAGTYESIHVRYPDGTSMMIDKIVDAGDGVKGQ
jgi:hypothetical protein